MAAQAEASERLGGRYEVRVLESSPPAVREGPWYADDPAAVGDVPADREVVTPTTAGDITWDDLAAADPSLAPFCADRWLGAWQRLPHAPRELVATREALHRLAEHVLAPARHTVNGKIGLRWCRGGFGTPFYGDDIQIRIAGSELVRVDGDRSTKVEIATVAAAAKVAQLEPGAPAEVYTPTTPLEPDALLPVDTGAADFLGELFGFGTSVLEQIRAEYQPDAAAGERVQMWPEHFDFAVSLGDEAAGNRVTYGVSPGDAANDIPYFYVLPWADVPDDPYWDAQSYRGANLSLDALADVDDQRTAILEFFRRGRALLDP